MIRKCPLGSWFAQLRLRTKFLLSTCTLLSLLLIFLLIIVEKEQRAVITAELEKRGRTIAGNLAAVSVKSLLTYNYVTLEQDAEKVAKDEDVLYVIILTKEGKVAAYSGRDEKQGEVLKDPVSQKAMHTRSPLVQTVYNPVTQEEGLDFAVPVFVPPSHERWGVVRVGLSLRAMRKEIARTRRYIAGLGLLILLIGIGGATIMAQRISSPIQQLVAGVIEVARGNLYHRIRVESGDEIGHLAYQFNQMTVQLLHQRRQLEIKHQELNQKLREISLLKNYNDSILRSMTSGVITLDLQGRIVTLNAMAEQLLEMPLERVRGVLLTDLLPDQTFTSLLLKTLEKGESLHQNCSVRREKGDALPISMTTSLLKDDAGKVTGILGVFQDLSTIRELEQQLRRADRLAAVGTLAAGVAHEIKNPLVSLKTFTQMLPRKKDDPGFLAKYMRIVPQELDRVNTIVEELLTLARPSKILLRPTAINDVLAHSIELYREQATAAGITIREEYTPDLPPISADPDHLKRVFGNLITNALQAMPQGGCLTVTSQLVHLKVTEVPAYQNNMHSSGGGSQSTLEFVPFVAIRFTDTGCGMTQEQLDALFTPFFTTKGKGTGLGLAISHKIIEEHGGMVQVESQPGKGTTFTVLLPFLYPA